MLKHGRRIALRFLLVLAAAGLLCYGLLLAYLENEAHRSSQAVHAMSAIRIGDSEESLRPLLDRFHFGRHDAQDDSRTYRYQWESMPVWSIRGLGHPFDWAMDTLYAFVPDRVRQRMGLREYRIMAGITLKNARVSATWVDVKVEGREHWLSAEWVLTERLREDPEIGKTGTYFFTGINLHIGYDSGRGVRGEITPAADNAVQLAARNINLKCLTSIRGCASLSELAPDATDLLHR